MSLIHRVSRVLPTLLVLLVLLPSALRAQPVDDGTTSDEWTLDNGLRVVVRNVPGAQTVAIVVAYNMGYWADPAGSEGFARLMAEAAFTAEAGDVPARTRAQLDELRPVGWNVQVEARRTELAEMATKERFPGILHQVASRMRGVKVTNELVDEARHTVTEQFHLQYVEDLGLRLYADVGVRATGGSGTSLKHWISGQGIASARTRDVAERIAAVYVPANAVLSLAGDFTGVNMRAFMQREFGDIPTGTAFQPPAAPRLKASQTQTTLAEAPRTLGAVGVLAPALADTSHPSFYLTMLMLGNYASIQWGKPNSPLSSRFQYSILDDPSTARFYPPIKSKSWTAANLSVQLNALAEQFNGLLIDYKSVQQVQQSVEWLLGGPLPEPLRERVKTTPPLVYRLASSAGARRLFGDAAFWREYRRRFDPTVGAGYASWHDYIRNKANHAAVVYLPQQ